MINAEEKKTNAHLVNEVVNDLWEKHRDQDPHGDQ